MNYSKFIFLLVSISFNQLFAQKPAPDLTSEEKAEAISEVREIILRNYVFPEIGIKIDSLLKLRQENGQYQSIDRPEQFAAALTEDIQSFNQDRHLRVLYEPDRIAKKNNPVSQEDSINNHLQYLTNLKRSNYGFKEVSILDGNIGYLDLRKFNDPKHAGETAAASINFLGNSEALIIDVRNNGGGTPKMVQLIASYFFESEPVHLNSFYKRQEDIQKQFWTLPFVPGKRLPEIPLFVLTSHRTFSAAEEFAYDLQQLDRALIIGESTGGGAHPGGRIAATDKFNVWTPVGRAINPYTNSNWEGTGVTPDIQTHEDEALQTAYIKALDSLCTLSGTNEDHFFFNWNLEKAISEYVPFETNRDELKILPGNYQEITISLDDNVLYVRQKDRDKRKLIPISNSKFIVDRYGEFKVQFNVEKKNVQSLVLTYYDGSETIYERESD